MNVILSKIPGDVALVRVAGGTIVKTDAPRIGFVNSPKIQYIQLANYGSVQNRTFLIRGVGFIAVPVGCNIEILEVDESQIFKFELLQ